MTTADRNDGSIEDFSIEFDDDKAGCYFADDQISGKVWLNIKRDTVLIHEWSASIVGCVKVACAGDGGTGGSSTIANRIDEDFVYLKKEWIFVRQPGINLTKGKHSMSFQQKLSDGLPSSFESKHGHVRYIIKTHIIYDQFDGIPAQLNTIRAMSISEVNDLNKLPMQFNLPHQQTSAKKFGWFACTGGHVKLSIRINRLAYVCGENINITGRIENKSNRRVDKISALLVQRILYQSVDNQHISRVESFAVHDESLALFIESNESIKIDRNFAIPPLAPTTLIDSESTMPLHANNDTTIQRRPILSTIASVVVVGRLRLIDHNSIQRRRVIRIAYRLIVRVKVDTSSFDIVIPLMIGTRPYKTVDSIDQIRSRSPTTIDVPLPYVCQYRQQRHDRPVVISAGHAQHINKYPFYTDLPTSSKQSKIINTLLHARHNLLRGHASSHSHQ